MKLCRLMLKLSQSQVAKELGVSFQQFQKYENGENRVSAANLNRIAKLFQVPMSYFFEPDDRVQDSALDGPDELLAPPILSRAGVKLVRAFETIRSAQLKKRIADMVDDLASKESERAP